jgi:hypothetical protein
MMTLSRNLTICAAELDGEICLFHPGNAEYLNLNATGSEVWNLLDVPMDREQLVAHLLERFAVEEATCRRDTEAFLEEAIARGMLLEDSSPP